MATVILTDEIITTKQILNKWKMPLVSDVITIKELIKWHVEIEYQHWNEENERQFFLVKKQKASVQQQIEQAIEDFQKGKYFISVGGFEAKSITDRVFLYRKTEIKFYQISVYS